MMQHKNMMQGVGTDAGAMMLGQNYTSSFSLSELTGILEQKMFGNVCVTCTEKSKILLEHRRDFHQQTRLHLEKGQTMMTIVCSDPPDCTLSYYNIDGSYPEDWDHYRNKLTKPESRRRMDNLTKALELCEEATMIDASDPRRTAFVDKAIDKSPDLCSKAYFMKFELLSTSITIDPFVNTTGLPDKEHTPAVNLCIRALKNGVSAGRNFVELIDASQIQGNLYTNLPTRWYVRCLYALGSFLFMLEDLDGADMYLKECLANDIHDKLGARNKQLLVSLEREEGIGGSEIPHLLKARFTEDQLEDDVTALWNYTRALHAFVKKGDSKSSKKLLAHAINKNPFVPPQLLAWESVISGEKFMVIGNENEAGDYSADNAKHWLGVKGALKWLEQAYCQLKNASPLTTDDECMRLLVAGTRLERKRGGAQEGIEIFQQLLDILGALPAHSVNRKLSSLVHQRKAHCHNQLLQYDDALRNYNSAMCFCDPRDRNSVKELFYNRAQCKENQGDLNGSLQDFTFVWERLGHFSTAHEGIQNIEAKLNVQTSVLPPSRRIGGVTESDEVVRRRVEDIVKSMPRVDPRETVAATVERCDHCKRSGVALAKCSGCSEAQFCSKQCLVASWKAVHKYVCKTSKRRLETGTKVRVRGLEKAPQHNGKIATIDRFLPDKSRFSIKVESEEDGQSPVMLSIRPENLEKVVE
jgi:tetratricopeptide (TPR) repeat protein